MKRLLGWSVAAAAAFLFVSPLTAAAQDDEDRRTERLRRIEQAIERLEQSLSRQLEEGQTELGELSQEGLEELGELMQLRPGRYYIGVQVASTEEESEGVLVESVVEESPAAEAGIQAGDVIIAVGDHKISDVEKLIEVVRENGDKPIVIVVNREDETMEIRVEPAERPVQQFELAFPEGIQEIEGLDRLLIPHAEILGEGRGLRIDPEMLDRLRLEVRPDLFGGEEEEREAGSEALASLRAEMDELREQMAQQREMMDELRQAIKELADKIKD